MPELLQDLGLEEYLELFAQNDYMTVKKVCSLWDNELFGVSQCVSSDCSAGLPDGRLPTEECYA